MKNRLKHIRFIQEFLGLKGTPIIHKLLDLPFDELRRENILIHRATHTPQYIQEIIRPTLGKDWDKDTEREAWLHILIDWLYPEQK